jgi:hypothetical protein
VWLWRRIGLVSLVGLGAETIFFPTGEVTTHNFAFYGADVTGRRVKMVGIVRPFVASAHVFIVW